MRTNKHLHQIYAEHQWTVCSLIDYNMLCFKAMFVFDCRHYVLQWRKNWFFLWLTIPWYSNTGWNIYTRNTANNYALSEGSSSSPDRGWQQTMRSESDNGAALVQTNLGVNSLECIFKTCVIGSIFTRLYCVESSSTWTLYVVVLQMVGVVLIGAAQLDLFIIALSKAATAVICFFSSF